MLPRKNTEKIVVIAVAAAGGYLSQTMLPMIPQQLSGQGHTQVPYVPRNTAAIQLTGEMIKLGLADSKDAA